MQLLGQQLLGQQFEELNNIPVGQVLFAHSFSILALTGWEHPPLADVLKQH